LLIGDIICLSSMAYLKAKKQINKSYILFRNGGYVRVVYA
jgi:hypothetical protein